MNRGGSHATQLMQYDIANHQLTDYGEDYLRDTMSNGIGEFGVGGYYSQLNTTMLYTIAYEGDYINSYDLQSLSYQQLSPAIPITIVDSGACLASSETPSPRLYVTGGKDDDYIAMNDLQVLDLDQSQWLTNVSSMQYSRLDHGCIVVDERLFVVGGFNLVAIEVINVMVIDSASWDTIGNLSDDRYQFGQLIAFQEVIYVIGGNTYDGGYLDTVYAIDIMSDTMGNVTVLPDKLPYSVVSMGTVIVDNTIYGFGGEDGDFNHFHTWISYEMLSGETQTECKNQFIFIDQRCCHRQTDCQSYQCTKPATVNSDTDSNGLSDI